MIRFGSMSIVLLLGMLHGLLFAALLWAARGNRVANRLLALLLIVIAMRMLPYAIGYAGYYDAYPWLSFAPWDAALGFGPLLYLHVHALVAKPGLPRRWGWHLAPVIVQLAYQCLIFTLPLAEKNDWDDHVHEPWIWPAQQLATFVSIAVYWWLSMRLYRDYQAWLAQHVSDREDHRLEWIRNFLIALALTLLLWAGMEGFERFVVRLDYFQRFPMFVWLGVLSVYLGTEGYRRAAQLHPAWPAADTPAVPSAVDPPAEPASEAPAEPARDWAELGARWERQLVAQGWWRDPELSLAALARHLGTNTSDLSRAINEGLGQNFNELVNRLRVQAVQAALSGDASAHAANTSSQAEPARTLLDIAFEAGFSSKASFNRCFKLYVSETPTQFRQRLRAGRLKS